MRKFFTILLFAGIINLFASDIAAETPDSSDLHWTSIGYGEFFDAWPYSSFKVARQYPRNWMVEVEECDEMPGYYRVINPYLNGNCPFTDNSGEGNPLYINACDPDGVYISPQDLGFTLNSSLGNIFVASKAGLDLANGIARNIGECKEAATVGRLYDNTITISASNCLMMLPNYSDGDYYWVSYDFILKLPGAGDYSVDVDYTMPLYWSDSDDCTEKSTFDVKVTKSDDVAELRYLLSYNVVQVSNELNEQVAALGETFTPGVLTVTNEYPDEFVGRASIYVVGLDSNGKVRCGDVCYVDFVSETARGPWKKVGTTKFDDVIIRCMYDNADSPLYDVDIEESESEPGLYRLKNVYSQKGYWTKQEIGNLHNHGGNHYLYVNACDPQAVYIEPSPVGFAGNYGSLLIVSYAKLLFDADMDMWAAPYLGTFENGRIRIPAGAVYAAESCYDNGILSPVNDYDFVVDIPAAEAGIEEVTETENSQEPVYYNLQGTRVLKPEPGTPVIRVTGSKVEKIIL